MARTLATYLAGLSRDELESMRRDIRAAHERLEDELRSVQFEENLISQALARKARRSSAPSPSAAPSPSSAGSTQGAHAHVQRAQVLELIEVALYDRPFNSGDVSRAFAERGITTTSVAVRHHLRALLKADRIRRYGPKEFVLNPDLARASAERSAQSEAIRGSTGAPPRRQTGFSANPARTWRGGDVG